MPAFAAALVVALTVWNNVVVNRLPGYTSGYVVANVAAAAVLLAVARAAGLSWDELGFGRRHLAAGARWGAICFAVVVAAYLAALALRLTRPLLADDRIAGLDAGEIAYRAVIGIPLGTVLWEEVAFRGVLLAVLARLLPIRAAVITSAAVFGVWHVRPTLSALAENDLAGGPLLTAVAVVLGCVATAVAGALLAWLRVRTGSLLAPFLLHVATNVTGVLVAAAAIRLG